MRNRSLLRLLIGGLLACALCAAGSLLRAQDAKSETANSAVPTFRVTTRMVTVDVVAKDKHGHPVPNLTADDFEVFEQVANKKKDEAQKISGFLAVNHEAIVASSKQSMMQRLPAGVYSNLVTTRLAVPPTILLLDSLNTESDSGTQARQQMVKMLASIPADTPVAVFILGHDLTLLQSFTRDPQLLHQAALKVMSTNIENGGLAIDPHDDPNSMVNQTLEMFGGDDEAPAQTAVTGSSKSSAGAPSGPMGGDAQMQELRRFEKENFAVDTDLRVRVTLDALRTIARHVSGYPGRKNLIWISTSFPMAITPDAWASTNNTSNHMGFEGNRYYGDLVAGATNALADARVSVYPVNPAGVQTQSFFQATKPPAQPGYGQQPYAEARTLNRESVARFSSVESMTELAQQTGGSVCVNNNDLGDCVKTAVEEGSTYYELAYYPDASNWHGEFHRIIVKSKRPGIDLSFRQGYYARAGESAAKDADKSGKDPQLNQAACADLLTSTSILVVAQALAPDKPGLAKYFLSVEPRMLTFTPGDDGKRDLQLDVAICSFDQSGKPLQYFQQHVEKKFEEKEYAALHGVPHGIEFAPLPGTARVRLVVRDTASGEMGSLNVPYAPSSAAAAITASPSTPPGSKN